MIRKLLCILLATFFAALPAAAQDTVVLKKYHADGALLSTCQVLKGSTVPNGLETVYTTTGQVYGKVIYRDGNPLSIRIFFPDGRLHYEVNYAPDAGGKYQQKGRLAAYSVQADQHYLRFEAMAESDSTYTSFRTYSGPNRLSRTYERDGNRTTYREYDEEAFISLQINLIDSAVSLKCPLGLVRDNKIVSYQSNDGSGLKVTNSGEHALKNMFEDKTNYFEQSSINAPVARRFGLRIENTKTEIANGRLMTHPTGAKLVVLNSDIKINNGCPGFFKIFIDNLTSLDGKYTRREKGTITQQGEYIAGALVWSKTFDSGGRLTHEYRNPDLERRTHELTGGFVEIMPAFNGGDIKTFRAWALSKVRFPAEAVQSGVSGRVSVSFVVDKTGAVTDIKVLSSPSRLLSEEVVRVLRSSPRWSPGMQRGEIVRVPFSLHIDFNNAQ